MTLRKGDVKRKVEKGSGEYFLISIMLEKKKKKNVHDLDLWSFITDLNIFIIFKTG